MAALSGVTLLASSGHYLAITDLGQALPYGTAVGLELTFENGQKATVSVGFNTAQTPSPRSSVNLHSGGQD